VVVSAVLPQFTVAPDTKFTPFTVRVKSAPPGTTETGEMLVMKGSGLGLAESDGTPIDKDTIPRKVTRIVMIAFRRRIAQFIFIVAPLHVEYWN
jgi:hypothetical protein